MSKKYPWIPKKYFAAVMFACKMIRENGYFNKAIDTAADYYNVDSNTLAKHVRARQAAGQRGVKRGQMKWFVVLEFYGSDAGGERMTEKSVVRGKSLDTVERRFFERDMEYNKDHDYGGCYAPYVTHNVFGPYDTKEQAESYLAKIEVDE
jgi:hypothetical protein